MLLTKGSLNTNSKSNSIYYNTKPRASISTAPQCELAVYLQQRSPQYDERKCVYINKSMSENGQKTENSQQTEIR